MHNRKVRRCGLHSIAPITPSVALRLQQPADGRHPAWLGRRIDVDNLLIQLA